MVSGLPAPCHCSCQAEPAVLVCQIWLRAGPAVVWPSTQPAEGAGKASAVNDGTEPAETVAPTVAVAGAAGSRGPAAAARAGQKAAASMAHAPAAKASANPDRRGICHLQVTYMQTIVNVSGSRLPRRRRAPFRCAVLLRTLALRLSRASCRRARSPRRPVAQLTQLNAWLEPSSATSHRAPSRSAASPALSTSLQPGPQAPGWMPERLIEWTAADSPDARHESTDHKPR
jgi:hypothetical protein